MLKPKTEVSEDEMNGPPPPKEPGVKDDEGAEGDEGGAEGEDTGKRGAFAKCCFCVSCTCCQCSVGLSILAVNS